MTTELIIVLALLLAGIPIAKLVEKIAVSVHRRRFGVSLERPPIGPISFSIAFSIIIVMLLGLLNIGIEFTTLTEILDILPDLVTIVLLSLLTIMLTRLVMLLIDLGMSTSGLKSLIENYGQKHLYTVAYWLMALFVFFSTGSSTFHIAGYDVSSLLGFLGTFTFPFLVLILLLVFMATKDIVLEAGKGLYMRQAGILRPGQYLIIDGLERKAQKMHLCGVVAEGKDGLDFIPYSRLMSGVSFRRTRTVLERLEDIKNRYVAQDPSYCGPASLSMVLKMFGFEYSQHEIGEKAKTQVSKHGEPAGTTPQSLIDVASKLTHGKIRGVWIDADHISDLRNELLHWLDEEALVIVDYKKSYLFSKAKKAHYSVCLGVSGDELLLLDPSSKAGGVYYADYRRVQAGMDTYSALFGGKRGYIVLAMDGSPAYKRISEGLIYLDESLYDKLTKNVTKGLADLQHRSRELTKVFPKRISNLLGKDEKITRLWRPKKKKEDGE